jgi:iron complex outermembrane recepter protein
MIRAPEWTANFGFNYEMPVGGGLKLRFSNNNQYSSRFPTFQAIGRPDEDNFQSAFLKVDASLALSAEDESWEVALIGKNITDKVVGSNCSPSNFAGGGVAGGPITGGTTSGPPGFAEVGCYSEAGRAIYLRLTLHARGSRSEPMPPPPALAPPAAPAPEVISPPPPPSTMPGERG